MYISKGQKLLSYLPPYTQYLELYLVHIQCSKYIIIKVLQGRSLVAQMVKNLSRVKDRGSIPGSGKSPGEGNVNPLQYSCLENSMDRRGWQATVHGVARFRND